MRAGTSTSRTSEGRSTSGRRGSCSRTRRRSACSTKGSRRSRGSSTRRSAPLLRRGKPQRGRRDVQARRHGLRHRPLQPAQDVLPATGEGGRAAGRWPCARRSSRICPRPWSCATTNRSASTTTGRSRSVASAGSQARSVSSYARTRTCARTGQGSARCPRWPSSTRTTSSPACGRLRPPVRPHCMHEFVLSARTLKREHGITALDVAKRLMDYGIHPPTVYFPLVVPEALMIEPTETEPRTPRRLRRCDAGYRARSGRIARAP